MREPSSNACFRPSRIIIASILVMAPPAVAQKPPEFHPPKGAPSLMDWMKELIARTRDSSTITTTTFTGFSGSGGDSVPSWLVPKIATELEESLESVSMLDLEEQLLPPLDTFPSAGSYRDDRTDYVSLGASSPTAAVERVFLRDTGVETGSAFVVRAVAGNVWQHNRIGCARFGRNRIDRLFFGTFAFGARLLVTEIRSDSDPAYVEYTTSAVLVVGRDGKARLFTSYAPKDLPPPPPDSLSLYFHARVAQPEALVRLADAVLGNIGRVFGGVDTGAVSSVPSAPRLILRWVRPTVGHISGSIFAPAGEALPDRVRMLVEAFRGSTSVARVDGEVPLAPDGSFALDAPEGTDYVISLPTSDRLPIDSVYAPVGQWGHWESESDGVLSEATCDEAMAFPLSGHGLPGCVAYQAAVRAGGHAGLVWKPTFPSDGGIALPLSGSVALAVESTAEARAVLKLEIGSQQWRREVALHPGRQIVQETFGSFRSADDDTGFAGGRVDGLSMALEQPGDYDLRLVRAMVGIVRDEHTDAGTDPGDGGRVAADGGAQDGASDGVHPPPAGGRAASGSQVGPSGCGACQVGGPPSPLALPAAVWMILLRRRARR
jgi:hypothetical protein